MVIRLDGARARSKFSATMFEPEVFRKQMYCIEESTCNIVGTFPNPPAIIQRPHCLSEPGELRSPCPPRYAPDGDVTKTYRMNTQFMFECIL